MCLHLLILEDQNETVFWKIIIYLNWSSQKIDHNGKGQVDSWIKTRFVSRSYFSVSGEYVKRIQDKKIHSSKRTQLN